MTGTPISPTDITVRPAAPVTDMPAGAATDSPTGGAQLPHPRETTEGRHRRGITVAALIARTASTRGARSADVAQTDRRGGAHRLRRPSGRHRAAWVDEAADRMAHRRTIGGRPARDIGRTALTLVLFIAVATMPAQILVRW